MHRVFTNNPKEDTDGHKKNIKDKSKDDTGINPAQYMGKFHPDGEYRL